MKTQNAMIRDHLLSGYPITPLSALRQYRVFRLASRINDLRREGMNIISTMVYEDGTRFAEYKLKQGE